MGLWPAPPEFSSSRYTGAPRLTKRCNESKQENSSASHQQKNVERDGRDERERPEGRVGWTDLHHLIISLSSILLLLVTLAETCRRTRLLLSAGSREPDMADEKTRTRPAGPREVTKAGKKRWAVHQELVFAHRLLDPALVETSLERPRGPRHPVESCCKLRTWRSRFSFVPSPGLRTAMITGCPRGDWLGVQGTRCQPSHLSNKS